MRQTGGVNDGSVKERAGMPGERRSTPYSLGEIFRAPLWLALISILGLIAALVGDGWADVLSWFALGVPLGIGLWMIARAKRETSERR